MPVDLNDRRAAGRSRQDGFVQRIPFVLLLVVHSDVERFSDFVSPELINQGVNERAAPGCGR